MSQRAFLSGLGVMGRRHLKGLVRAGFPVVAFDPSQESEDRAREDLRAEGLDPGAFSRVTTVPEGEFAVAVFSETAVHRFANVRAFAGRAMAERVLLEKPLSGDPSEVAGYGDLLSGAAAPRAGVFVNFPRRTWPFYTTVRELAASDTGGLQVTVNGGAFGFGCNGIHYLDLFRWLCGGVEAEVVYVRLSEVAIASGRGPEFRDFGGEFLLTGGKASMYCSGEAASSASAVMTLRGDHFVAWVDESDLSYRLRVRDGGSEFPNYRCGADYADQGAGVMTVEPLDRVTEGWALGQVTLPTLEEALPSHQLLHRILEAGGARAPYPYT